MICTDNDSQVFNLSCVNKNLARFSSSSSLTSFYCSIYCSICVFFWWKRFIIKMEFNQPRNAIIGFQLQCCGIETFEEWTSRNLTGTPFPMSCMNSNDQIFEPGCLDRLYYIISECALLIGTGGILVAVVQVSKQNCPGSVYEKDHLKNR